MHRIRIEWMRCFDVDFVKASTAIVSSSMRKTNVDKKTKNEKKKKRTKTLSNFKRNFTRSIVNEFHISMNRCLKWKWQLRRCSIPSINRWNGKIYSFSLNLKLKHRRRSILSLAAAIRLNTVNSHVRRLLTVTLTLTAYRLWASEQRRQPFLFRPEWECHSAHAE